MGVQVTSDASGYALSAIQRLQPLVNEIVERLSALGWMQDGLPCALTLLAAACITEAKKIQEFNESGEGDDG